ncbi:unnamed protein product, partial [Ectocarpus sp. 12 AP-2014]
FSSSPGYSGDEYGRQRSPLLPPEDVSRFRILPLVVPRKDAAGGGGGGGGGGLDDLGEMHEIEEYPEEKEPTGRRREEPGELVFRLTNARDRAVVLAPYSNLPVCVSTSVVETENVGGVTDEEEEDEEEDDDATAGVFVFDSSPAKGYERDDDESISGGGGDGDGGGFRTLDSVA